MRLEKELGALNSEILSIKEKWKIALNIDKKKIAIERLISMRRVRDSEKINSEIESAVKSEERKLEDLVVRDVERYEAVEQAKVRENVERELEVESTLPHQPENVSIVEVEKGIEAEKPKIDMPLHISKEPEDKIDEVVESEAIEVTEERIDSVIGEKKPPHMTVDWLKRRMIDKR
jgi:hypothetical protein